MIKTLILIVLILAPQLSGACSGIRFTMRWTEPTTKVDGTPLTDLAKTTLYYQINTAIPKAKDYPSKVSTGGISKTASLTPLMNCKSKLNVITWWVTATDTSGLISQPSNSVIVNIPMIQ